jgi:hypothetical protein
MGKILEQRPHHRNIDMANSLSKRSKYKRLEVPNTGKNMGQRNSHSLLVGMQTDITTLERCTVFYKTKYTLNI